MMLKKTINLILPLFCLCIVLPSCDSDTITGNAVDPSFVFLKGTWVDHESFALQFLDFFSEGQMRFGLYSQHFARFDTANYRVFDGQIALDFVGDTVLEETVHELIIVDSTTIKISDLTVIPENPYKVYKRRGIVTDRMNDTIVVGYHQIYYDFEYGFQLEIDSVVTDSRCPIGAVCVWAGNAAVQFDLIIGGNYQHHFVLNTYPHFQTDTVIQGIKYTLADLEPYPEIGKPITPKDYIAKLLTQAQ